MTPTPTRLPFGSPTSPAPANASGDSRVCVDSEVLLRGQKMVEISHNGTTYRLHATRLGKLILTK